MNIVRAIFLLNLFPLLNCECLKGLFAILGEQLFLDNRLIFWLTIEKNENFSPNRINNFEK